MNIQEILDRASQLKIAVIGDLIEDNYIIGDVKRISPEAPVQVVNVTEHRTNWGGAGNVVENLKGLGVEVSFFYNDGHVPKKTRVMSGNHHLLRIDEEQDPMWQRWDDIAIGLAYGIENQKFNCVVISDYGKGMISHDVSKHLIELCLKNDIPVIADSKCNLDQFEGATLVKCNHKEWYSQDIPFPESPWGWMKDCEVINLVVTHGDKGMEYYRYEDGDELSGRIAAHPVAIADACGAGDTVIAVLAMMIALGERIDHACELANIAGSEVCRYPGVKPINKDDLMKRYNEIYESKTI